MNQQKNLSEMTLDELVAYRFEQIAKEHAPTPPNHLESWHNKTSKPRVEDTSTRSTFLLDNKLIARLNRVSSNQKRGFKTWLVNKAISDMLDRLEDREI